MIVAEKCEDHYQGFDRRRALYGQATSCGAFALLACYNLRKYPAHGIRREKFRSLNDDARRTTFEEAVAEVARMLDQNLLLKFQKHIVSKKGVPPLCPDRLCATSGRSPVVHTSLIRKSVSSVLLLL